MAGNARFHDKHHRTNHHTLSTAGFPDSATDPIASPSQPFQGDFVVNGVLSSSRGLNVLSADYAGDIYCENIYVRDTTYTDFISGQGTETIISDGALTGYGANTLTLDFGSAIYAKTPIVNFTNSISAASAVYTSFAKFSSLSSTSISAKDIFTNSLSAVSLTSNTLTSNSLSSRSLSSDIIISNSLSSKNLSATDISISNNVTVSGNCLIFGNLSALGDLTVIETTLQSSSAFEIKNTNTSLPALKITQSGTGDVVVLNYETIPNYLKIDAEKLTLNGKISGLSGVYSPNINEITNTSNSVFSTVSSNSANWRNTYSSVSSNSAKWESVYSNVSSNSANWTNAYTTVSSNSANWRSVYSNVSANSANWTNTYIDVSNNKNDWNDTASIVYFNSAYWDSVYSTVSFNSGNWDSVYSTVSSNSANWESTYSTVSSNSAHWQNTFYTVTAASANWESTYSTVSSNSANWESTKSTVNSNSASWLSGNTTLNFVASSIKTDTLSANILSANIIRVYQAIHVSVSSVSVSPGSTTTMTVNSPSYYFVNVTSAGTANFNLPTTNGNNIGMLFYIKNVSIVNNEIVSVNNSAGTPLTNGILNGGNSHHIEVVWDGTTWQQISLA